MAVALQSPGHDHAIHAALEGVQDLGDLHAARAGHLDDAHAGRVLDAQAAGQVGRGVSAVLAGKGQDCGFELVSGH